MKNEVIYKLQVAWDRTTYVTYIDEVTLGNLSLEESNIAGFAGGLNVTLDDTNGELYTLFESVNFHKAPARLLKDDVIFFVGEVTSPINWSEDQRTITFTIDSKVEDREVGFSLEESTIQCAKQSIDKPWPLCFGNVLHVPATKVVEARTGTLMEPMGIIDPLLQPSIDATLNAYYQEYYIFTFGQTQLGAISSRLPPIEIIAQAYIDAMARRRILIELRDANIVMVKQAIDIGLIPELDSLWELLFGEDSGEDDFKKAVIGRNPSLEATQWWNTFVGGDWRGAIISLYLERLGLFFEWFKQFVEYANSFAKLYQDTLTMVKEALDNMQKLHAHYIKLRNEYCEQAELVKDCVTINCGTTFPQNEQTDILIDNIRWRGEFDGEEFCFDTPGSPLSLYEDLEVKEWENEPDACGHLDNFTNLDNFYLEDDSVNLTGLYALVEVENQVTQRLYRTFEIETVYSDRIVLTQEVNMDIDSHYTLSGNIASGVESATAVGTTVTFSNSPNLSAVSIDGTSVLYLKINNNWRAYEINGVDNVNKNVSIRGTVVVEDVDYRISDTPVHGNKTAYTKGLKKTVYFRDDPDLSAVVPGMLFSAFVRVSHSHHIIKITGQEEDKVTFDLVSKGSDQSVTFRSGGSSGRQSYTPLPFYGFGRGPLPWSAPVLIAGSADTTSDQLSATLIAALLGSGINYITPDEHKDLLTIQGLAKQKRLLSTPVLFALPAARDLYYVIGEDISKVLKVAKMPLPDWFDPIYPIPAPELPDNLHWEVEYGELVHDATAIHEVFVANLLPSEIKSIMAYRNIDGEDVLLPVPARFYTYNEAEDLGVFTVTAIRFPRSLQSIDSKWKEGLYVSLNSTVGPNVVDILEHLIDTYTDFTVDATFEALREHADMYPCNFALLNRKNVMQQLQEIAWQARYRLTLINNVFSLTYLSSIPTPVDELDDAETIAASESMVLNTTEDLVTKMLITWRESYLPNSELKFIVRHNIDKYGLQKKDYEWYIYTDRDLIIKSATFWLIRYANMWNHFQVTTDIQNTWKIGEAVTFGETMGVIIRQEFDFNNYLKHQTLWLPTRNGEETPYTFAWPADAAADAMFPQVDEIDSAGSQSPGRNLDRLPTGLIV